MECDSRSLIRPVPRWPAVTACLALIAVAVLLLPRWATAWQYERKAVAAGEVWRLLTGHLTHWNIDHALWDILLFIVLGSVVERRGRRRLLAIIITSALIISLGTYYAESRIAIYRGLSGVDAALFAFLAFAVLADAVRHGWPGRTWLSAGLIVAFATKLVYEATTGATIFVDNGRDGFEVLVLAHLLGSATGAVVALHPTSRGVFVS